MNPKLKLILYLVLGGCLAFFGYRTLQIRKQSSVPVQRSEAATNGVASTNLAAIGTTNANEAALTNQPTSTNTTNMTATEAPDEATARRSSERLTRLMAYGGAAFLSLVGLAILLAQDVSRFFANRVDDFIFNDNLEGVKDPEYDEAEEVWKRGQHLDAVRLMRDYLKKNPREQYVALRIAEIYENDLRNYLAAALEYEEILKKRLPAERWGWAAVHLANLYSGRLNKSEHAEALLHRIVKEYGQTAAAKKARERLGISEPVPVPETGATPAPTPEPAPKEPKPEDSNLPPGFRPKK